MRHTRTVKMHPISYILHVNTFQMLDQILCRLSCPGLDLTTAIQATCNPTDSCFSSISPFIYFHFFLRWVGIHFYLKDMPWFQESHNHIFQFWFSVQHSADFETHSIRQTSRQFFPQPAPQKNSLKVILKAKPEMGNQKSSIRTQQQTHESEYIKQIDVLIKKQQGYTYCGK